MSSTWSRLAGVAALAAVSLLLAGCPSDDDPAAPPITPLPIDPGEGGTSPDDTTGGGAIPADDSLQAIAAACTDGGVVVVDRSIQVSSTHVDFPDCEIQLAAGVDMELSDMSISGDQLVITKAAGGEGTNLLTFERLSIEVQSLVIALDGPDDAFRTSRISITTNDGVDIRVGDLNGNGGGDGGTIHLIETSLTATDPDSIVQLVTSDGSGTLRIERSSIDTPGTPRLSGAECVAEVNDTQVECAP